MPELSSTFLQTPAMRWSTQHKLRIIALIFLGVAALALSAQLGIPLQPVPVTLQPIVITLIAIFYGRQLATTTVASYVMLGTLGAPIFYGFTGGPAILPGITGGYLVGMIVATYIMGWLFEIGFAKRWYHATIAIVIAKVALYTLGVMVLTRFVGFSQALQLGVYPFLTLLIIKSVIFGIVVPKLWTK